VNVASLDVIYFFCYPLLRARPPQTLLEFHAAYPAKQAAEAGDEVRRHRQPRTPHARLLVSCFRRGEFAVA
jgi:hypothetical protein